MNLKYLDLQVNLGWGFTKQASVWGCFGISWIFLAEAKYKGGEEEGVSHRTFGVVTKEKKKERMKERKHWKTMHFFQSQTSPSMVNKMLKMTTIGMKMSEEGGIACGGYDIKGMNHWKWLQLSSREGHETRQ